MNKLPHPQRDETAILQHLAGNTKLLSYPHIQDSLEELLQAYIQYEAAEGNVLDVLPVHISDALANHLKAHYKSPPAVLSYIREQRLAHENRTCPMCGSMRSGTLDHLLPKADFPAFAVFSPNLVPACTCNSKRRNTVAGQMPGARILHPYFDDCLSERLIKACFENLGQVPRCRVRLCVGATHPQYEAIVFHVETVVKRSGIKDFLLRRWAKLCLQPSLAVRPLLANFASIEDLHEALTGELHRCDQEHDSKNNWYSVFVAGLLEPHVMHWLFQQMQRPGRSADGPMG